MTPVFTLVVALLSIQSSYVQDSEKLAVDVPDTIQFWFPPDAQWRIRTYAIEHDIHVYSLGASSEEKIATPDFAVEHIKKHYSDVTASLIVLKFANPTDQTEVARILAAHNQNGTLEVSKSGIAFYNPDRGHYRTKSTPK